MKNQCLSFKNFILLENHNTPDDEEFQKYLTSIRSYRNQIMNNYLNSTGMPYSNIKKLITDTGGSDDELFKTWLKHFSKNSYDKSVSDMLEELILTPESYKQIMDDAADTNEIDVTLRDIGLLPENVFSELKKFFGESILILVTEHSINQLEDFLYEKVAEDSGTRVVVRYLTYPERAHDKTIKPKYSENFTLLTDDKIPKKIAAYQGEAWTGPHDSIFVISKTECLEITKEYPL